MVCVIKLEKMLKRPRSLLGRRLDRMYRNRREVDLRDVVAMNRQCRLQERHRDFTKFLSYFGSSYRRSTNMIIILESGIALAILVRSEHPSSPCSATTGFLMNKLEEPGCITMSRLW